MNLATVMTVTPDLTIRNDGDTVDIPARTTDTIVTVSDRVLVELIDNTVYILGKLTSALATDPIPTGVILPWSSSVAPAGYLMCLFQAVSRTDYPNLNTIAAANGYTGLWGPGNGTTTFNVPDGRGRTFVGAGTFAAFGVTDGLTESARTLRHVHPVTNQVAHNHGIDVGGDHTHNVSMANDHVHGIDKPKGGTGAAGELNVNTDTSTSGGGRRITDGEAHQHSGQTGSNGAHDHGGSVNGNGGHGHGGATQNNGGHDHGGVTGQSALNAVPFFAGNYIIKT